MRCLIAKDEALGALLLERTLSKAGHEVEVCQDEFKTLARCQSGRFDAVLVDLVLPGAAGGLTLLRSLRSSAAPPYLIAGLSRTISTDDRREFKMLVDVCLDKPYGPERVIALLQGMDRPLQSPVAAPAPVFPLRTVAAPATRSNFACVAIASGIGGPATLPKLFRAMNDPQAAFLIIQHGPAFVIDSLLGTLKNATRMPVKIASEGDPVLPGMVYLAPADQHVEVTPGLQLHLTQAPPENSLRPSADVLLRSLAATFGSRCVALILSGSGHDGGRGCAQVSAAGGTVYAQDPTEAVAPAMPANLLSLGVAKGCLRIDDMAVAVQRHCPAQASRRLMA